MAQKTTRSLAETIGTIHLGYLSLLPAAGTFSLLAFLHINVNGFLFLVVGTAAIGIYLGVTNSYTPIGTNAAKNLFRLLDGPAWIIAGALLFHTPAAVAIVQTVVVETAAVLIGTMGVVLTSRIPTRDQRVASVFAVGIPLVGVVLLAWFVSSSLGLAFTVMLLLLGGAVEGAISHFRLVNKDEVMRPSEGYIILGIVAWILALFVGYGVLFSTTS